METEMVTHWCKYCRKQFLDRANRRGGPRLYCSNNCRKRHWDENNNWKRYDECPGCGGLKYIKSQHCNRCRPPGNPLGINGR